MLAADCATTEYLTSRPRVLVVDTEPMSRTLMDAVLRTDDRYEVLTARDGAEGLDLARQAGPDLLLVTTALPGCHDGLSVCRALKSEPGTRRIPVVLVTGGQATPQERAAGLEAGADDFLCKPFNRTELLARVRSLLRIKALNDQLDGVEEMAYALSRMIEAREGGESPAQGESHTERVVAYALALGEALGLGDEELRVLRQAATLRDIGKVGLPDRLLNKPGALDDRELQDMQRHTILGEQMMAPLRPRAAALPAIIRHHHERVDGRGYPDGLAGDQIPLGARIVAIADAYHAMTSHRPYRPAMPPAKALGTLQAGAGKQWDARLVGHFVDWAQRQPAAILTAGK